jgi:hypothetical protein
MALLWGCGSTTDVALALADGDGDCMASLPQIKTLSIEALANDGKCRLAHECVFDVVAATVGDLEAALHASAEILLELDPGDAQILTVNGRKLNDCFPRDDANTPVICGHANLAAARDGTLLVELQAGGCIESIPLCP